MTNPIIGRNKELALLKGLANSSKSEFVAVYGRRRVGKTFLIRRAFEQGFAFQVTGLANASLEQQLLNFHVALEKIGANPSDKPAENWLYAFLRLSNHLEKLEGNKKVIFIDELPWFDTKGSGFVQALEHFWNSWASARSDIVLITCGSAASWMINKLLNNHGGLHNRVTKRLKINPFTLHECEAFLRARNSSLERYQIIQLYMALGGIPFYWDEVEPNQSAAQNIEQLCFSENGPLRTEFNNLFSSLFSHSERHIAVVRAIASKAMGLMREEIIALSGLPNGGTMSTLLQELEESGFIRRYVPFGKKTRNSLYQLVDFYTLFYLRFLEGLVEIEENHWINGLDNPQFRAWSGYAFEQVCLYHVAQIKKALGISGVQTSTSVWRGNSGGTGAQIDLLIDRRDQVINLCEMKYSVNEYSIDKKYAEELRNKVGVFKAETGTKKSVFLTMVTTFGLKQNQYSLGLVQNELRMEVLFEE